MHPVDFASIDLNLLKLLDALLKEGGVTRAGQRLGLSQPAASRALARLRTLLGDPLLVRTTHGQELTPRALALAEPLERLLSGVRDIVAPEDFDPATLQGRFTLASMDHLSTLVVPGLVTRLARLAPLVGVDVLPARGDNVDLVARGDADVAIGRFDADRLPANMHRRALYEETLVCVLRHDHPALDHPWTRDTFLSLSHVATTITGDGPGLVDDMLARQGLARRIVVRLPQFLTAPMVVAESDVVAVLPARLARRMAGPLSLAVRDVPLDLPGFTLSMIWHARTHRDRAGAWLRDAVSAVVDEREEERQPPIVGSSASTPGSRLAKRSKAR
ncbi:MAG: HTH-type transcriptional regulator SyrM 1 [Luteibacter sp.]|uniref:LysR family transcriptional regulator n=1 Tax=Luteibacter sp. TaxID=1886636 RepID=UPI0013860F00|nr:LysR family transcriptional regulator [Luteibacter sp.]KAF1004645.1 MAG: HTH-type transcriptional regulator SyrM 1 [Luteibacter sp.]